MLKYSSERKPFCRMKLKSEILAQLNAAGFLGTGATFAADFNLIVQLLMGVALLLGMILARRRHYRGGGGGAAAAAAFAGIVGTGIAIAATQNRRQYYDYGYYGGKAYNGDPAPYYAPRGNYGGGPYYRSW